MRRLTLLGLVLASLVLFIAAPGVAAQDDPNDDIRSLFPPGEPGDLDLTEEDERWQQFVELFGESTDVADFGDGSELTGPCGGQAYSYDGDGNIIDAAFDAGDEGPPIDLIDGGQAFTASNPFRVDTAGVVVYFGFYPFDGEGPQNHTWTITTEGISLDSGGDDNPGGNNRNTGVVDLAENLPFGFSFKAKVQAEITPNPDEPNPEPCFAQGHVDFEGPSPLTSVPGLIGGVGLLGGIFGLLFNARPAVTYKAA